MSSAQRKTTLGMPTLLLEEPISPELVLVAPPEEAEAARAALPDIREFYGWIAGLREVVEPILEEEPLELDGRRRTVFIAVVCLNAVVPLALIVFLKLFA